MPHRTQYSSGLAIVIAIVCGQLLSQDKESSLTDAELESILESPDALMQIIEGEPQPDITEDIVETPSSFLLITSLSAGVGHSDNFLKKYTELQDSNYLQIEFDAFASWSQSEVEMSAMVFAEATLYDFDLEPSEETLAFAQLNGLISKDVLDFGFEASFLYGSFIYDSSLTAVSIASGTDVSQIMPKLELFTDWYAPGSNRIRFSLAASRSEFNIENQDYWDPALGLELKHVWTPTLITTTSIDYSRQVYDDEVARDPAGDPLPGEILLEVDRLSLAQQINWKPDQWKWLQIDFGLGVALEDENAGSYESMRYSWIHGRMTITNGWGKFKFSGKWGEYQYDDRQVSLIDTRLHLQRRQSLVIEYSRSLPWDFSIMARSQWSALKSRIYEDTYSERRAEILLQWSY